MSHIKFDTTDNSVCICNGKSKPLEVYQITEINQYLEILGTEEKFSGVKLKEFMSDIELDGLKCEEKFKELLDSNDVHYLYIGQGPFGIERSKTLIEDKESKRADFIINMPNIGSMLFDVKCRKKLGFYDKGERCFYLYAKDLKPLYNLQKLMLMPVWLAFYDRALLNNKKNGSFHIIPISVLNNFWEHLNKNYKVDSLLKPTKVIRIPNDLLTEIADDKIVFNNHDKIDKKIYEAFAENYRTLDATIQSKILQFIQEKNCYKTTLPNKLCLEDNNELMLQEEIKSVLEQLIKSGSISFESHKRLSIIKN